MNRQTDSAHLSGLRAYLLGEESTAQRVEIEGHLLGGCLACVLAVRREQRRLQAEGSGRGAAPPGEEDLAAALERRAAAAQKAGLLVDAERRVAPELLAELLRADRSARREEVRTAGRYRLYALAELLVERAREECFHDVVRAVELAELALEVAEAVPPALYPPGAAHDLCALAWGALGNAHRVRMDLHAAERALAQAVRLVGSPAGTGDPLERAELLSLLGSLRIDQARFDGAAEALGEAAAIYRRAGERHREGKTLVKLAKATVEAADLSGAAEHLTRAEGLLDPSQDRQVYLHALQARTAVLNEAGRIDEAEALYRQMLPQWERELEGFAARQRVRWLGGLIAGGRGDLERAEVELEAVREAFGAREEAYLYALVTLDLAALHLERGRTGEVRRLAEEMLPIFASHQIHHHALAALVLFQQAAVAETASAGLVAEVAAYLRRARANPELPFLPSVAGSAGGSSPGAGG